MSRLFAAAMILGMLWPAAGLAAPAGEDGGPPIPAGQEAVFGPALYTRGNGAPAGITNAFDARPGGDYTLLIEDLGPSGLLAEVWLNGRPVVTEGDLSGRNRALATMAVTLLEQNEIRVRLAGKPGSRLRVTIYGEAQSAAWQEPCAEGAAPFTTAPVPPDLLVAVVPLGAVAPPTRTLPIPHVSLSPVLDAASTPVELPVYAPARATLVAVERRVRGGDLDLVLHLQPCRDVRVSLQPLGRLAPELEATLDGVADRYCPDADHCIDAMEVEVAAGSLLGHGGAGHGPVAFGVEDARVTLAFANPDRYAPAAVPGLWTSAVPPDVVDRVLPNRLSAACGLDYVDSALRTTLQGKLASPDGSRQRTAAPVCGEHMQDVPGSAQGNWFAGADDSALVDESTAVALVHDNVDPSRGVFSAGGAVPWGPDAYGFAPALTGFVNTDFSLVVPGSVYCYQGLRGSYGSLGGRVLLELFSEAPGVANRLRIEHRSGTCSTFPWSFTSGVQVLQR